MIILKHFGVMQKIGLNNHHLNLILTCIINTLPVCALKIVMFITLMSITKIIKIQTLLVIIKA